MRNIIVCLQAHTYSENAKYLFIVQVKSSKDGRKEDYMWTKYIHLEIPKSSAEHHYINHLLLKDLNNYNIYNITVLRISKTERHLLLLEFTM